MLGKFADLLHKLARGAVLTLLAVILALVIVQIVMRYGFGRSLSWSEEIVRYLLIWLTFIGSSVAVREGGLVGLDLLDRVAQRVGLAKSLNILVSLLGLLFVVALAYYGTLLAMSPSVTRQSFATMPVSMVWVYAVIPISSFLTAVQLIQLIIGQITGKERA